MRRPWLGALGVLGALAVMIGAPGRTAQAAPNAKRKTVVLEYRSGSSGLPGIAKRVAAAIGKQSAGIELRGSKPSAVGTAVGYLTVRFAELDWRGRHPNLAAMSDRLEARPSFQGSVPYAQSITEKVV